MTRRRFRYYGPCRIESQLAEERRAADERIEAARARRRHISAVRVSDTPALFAVVIERGSEANVYSVKFRSPSAYRLARLVGDSGRPLFSGINVPKAIRQ